MPQTFGVVGVGVGEGVTVAVGLADALAPELTDGLGVGVAAEADAPTSSAAHKASDPAGIIAQPFGLLLLRSLWRLGWNTAQA